MSNVPIEVRLEQDVVSQKQVVSASFHVPLMQDAILHSILEKVAARIADRYVEENYPDIAARINPQAIANLSIARGAGKVAEGLDNIGGSIRHFSDNYRKD